MKFLTILLLICFFEIFASYEYESDADSKSSNNRISNKLSDLFNTSFWRLNINSSSPCTYTGDKMLEKCHQVHEYNEKAYNKYINQLKTMILSNLNIKNETNLDNSKLKNSQIKLLKEISDRNRDSESWIRKTRFDKNERKTQVTNLVRNIEEIYRCKFNQNSKVKQMDALCLKFLVSTADLFQVDQQNNVNHFNGSIKLFLHFKMSEKKGSCQYIKITNPEMSKNITLKVENGWNSVNIYDLVISNEDVKFLNESLFIRLAIVSEKDCLIESDQNKNDVNTQSTTDISILYLSSSRDKKPLLDVIYNPDLNEEDSNKNLPPVKQKRDSEVDILKNICKVPLSLKEECCLIQYYIEFRSLFSHKFILKPLGFHANYCFGKCFSKVYNIQPNPSEPLNHAEIKNKFNLFNKEYDKVMPTCCHPTAMKGLEVTYLDSKGSYTTVIIKNMITTSCGCS